MNPSDNEGQTERWHVGREIPLAVIFGLVVQTVGLVWFAATQTAKLDNVIGIMTEYRVAQYTQSDARRDQDLQAGRSANNARRIDETVRRIEALENGRKSKGT